MSRNTGSKKKRNPGGKKKTGTGKPAETVKSTANAKNQATETIKNDPDNVPVKRFVGTAVIGALAVAVAAVFFIFRGGTQPTINLNNTNLLVITLDTLRADRIGAYGYGNARTPNLDRLAREGILFENCYSPVPLTNPSHSSIFTGRYPVSHGVRGNGRYKLPDAEVTLAEKMKAAGYHTSAVIASFVLHSKFGLGQGFDYFDDSLDSRQMHHTNKSEIPASTVLMKFKQWFETNHTKRFFAWVHLYDPHEPYNAPKTFRDKFGSDLSGRYDAEIAFTDDIVGRIIDELKRKNVLDNTLVVIIGDHGESFGEHQEFGHGIFCYDDVLKVPLIFYNPKQLPLKGHRILNRVNQVDLMPTLLELYGIDIPSAVQGKSIVPLLTGEEEDGLRNFYFESMHGSDEMGWAPLLGIIEGHYKYISLPRPELYNLRDDQNERDNLFQKKNRLAKEMDKKLQARLTELSASANDADARRTLSSDDKKQLSSLGYISPFSGEGNKKEDPKTAIILDNKLKTIFKLIGENQLDKAESQLDLLEETGLQTGAHMFHMLRFQIYQKRGDSIKCIEILKDAMEKFPQNKPFYILYALQMVDRGNHGAARSACRELLRRHPDFTHAHTLLGDMEDKEGRPGSAVHHYKRAIEIEPENIRLKLKYAELLIRTKANTEALSLYDDLMERRELSQNAEFLFKVALFHSKYGTLTKTEQVMKRIVEIAPKGKYFYNYALVLARNRKIREALKNMEIALSNHRAELNPQQLQLAEKAINNWKQNI